MSLPSISISRINHSIALYNVIGSIALQESAIAEMMDASGRTLQRVVELTDPEGASFDDRYANGAPEALDDLLVVNDAVNEMLAIMRNMESELRGKLCCVLKYLNSCLETEKFDEEYEEPIE